MSQDNLEKLLNELNELSERLGKARARVSEDDAELMQNLAHLAFVDWTVTEMILIDQGKRGKPLTEMLLYYGLVHLVHVCLNVSKNIDGAEEVAQALGNAAQRAVHYYKKARGG